MCYIPNLLVLPIISDLTLPKHGNYGVNGSSEGYNTLFSAITRHSPKQMINPSIM